jgi:hypothetical protein
MLFDRTGTPTFQGPGGPLRYTQTTAQSAPECKSYLKLITYETTQLPKPFLQTLRCAGEHCIGAGHLFIHHLRAKTAPVQLPACPLGRAAVL